MIHIAVATEILNKFLTKLFRSKVEHPAPGTFIFLFERCIPAGRLRWWQLERGWGGGRGVTFGERSGFEPKLSYSLEVQPPKSKGLFLPILLLSDSFYQLLKVKKRLMSWWPTGGGGDVSDTAAFLSLFPCNHHHHFPATSAAAVSLTAGHCGWVWRTEPLYFSLRPATARRKPHYSKCESHRRFEEYKGLGLVARSAACLHNMVPIIPLVVFVYYILKFNSFDPVLPRVTESRAVWKQRRSTEFLICKKTLIRKITKMTYLIYHC